jgi:hypothetical protein
VNARIPCKGQVIRRWPTDEVEALTSVFELRFCLISQPEKRPAWCSEDICGQLEERAADGLNGVIGLRILVQCHDRQVAELPNCSNSSA